MLEYRTERLHPQTEERVTKMFEKFGWKPESRQEIYSESAGLAGGTVTNYGVTVEQSENVINYIVVKYSRDTEMPNYERLKALNDEHERLINKNLGARAPRKPLARTIISAIGVAGIFVLFLSLMIDSIGEPSRMLLYFVFSIFFVLGIFSAIMAPITSKGWIKYKRELNSYNQIQRQIAEIEAEALSLLQK